MHIDAHMPRQACHEMSRQHTAYAIFFDIAAFAATPLSFDTLSPSSLKLSRSRRRADAVSLPPRLRHCHFITPLRHAAFREAGVRVRGKEQARKGSRGREEEAAAVRQQPPSIIYD